MPGAGSENAIRESEADLLVLIGAGGHGRVVAEAATASGWRCVFCDPARAQGERIGGVEVVAQDEDAVLDRFIEAAFILAVGPRLTRQKIAARLAARGVRFGTVIHPSAIVSPTARIEPGAAVLSGAIVNADAVVGTHAIINSAAVIEHDCVIGEGVHVSPGAVLTGGVRVGDWAEIGARAVVLPGRCVCAQAQIGAGAVVTRGIAAPGVYVGMPARRR